MSALRITAEATHLGAAMAWLDTECAANRIGADDAGRLAIVLEELFLNVTTYGGAPPPSVELTFARAPLALELILEDDGVPFDPTAEELPNLSDDADDRTVGGLGIHIVMELMDEVSYERAGDRNRVTLRKFLRAVEASGMESAIEELIRYAGAHEADFEGPRAVIPTKHVTIVTCMDSRIDTFRIFGLDSGEAHILRNAGGLVTDDMLRSLVLSQRLLQTREVLLMHHTNCGLHRTDEAALRAAIAAETGAEPPYPFGAFADLDAAVRAAIVRVREHPFLPHRDRVRGFVYEVESGHVREVFA
jgi:carbonic anhydrase